MCINTHTHTHAHIQDHQQTETFPPFPFFFTFHLQVPILALLSSRAAVPLSMTQLYSSSAKLFSLLYSSNKSGRHQQQQQHQQHNSSISPNTTHIAVITQKDGTVVTRCLNRRPLTSPTDSSISNNTLQSSKKQRCFAFLKFSGLRNRSSPLAAGPSSPLPSCEFI